MDSSPVGNHNKVKVMATQLLAKFEENAPAQHSGLKRQVWRKLRGSSPGFTAGGIEKALPLRKDEAAGKICSDFLNVAGVGIIVVCFSLQ